MSNLFKIYKTFNYKQKIKSIYLFVLIIIAMLWEMLSFGLVLPAISLLIDPSLISKNIYLQKLNNQYSDVEIIFYGLIFLILIYVIKSFYLVYFNWEQTKFTKYIQTSFSNLLIKIYLNQNWIFHTNHNSSKLISNIMNEVALFVTLIESSILFFTELVVLIGILLVLLYLEPYGVFSVASVLFILLLCYYLITKNYLLKWGALRQIHESKRIKDMQESFGGIKDLILLGRQNNFLKKFYYNNNEANKLYQYNRFINQIPKIWLELFAVISLVALSFVMILKYDSFTNLIPTLGLFAFAAFKFIPAANRIINTLQTIRYSIPSVELVTRELDMQYEKFDANNKKLNKKDFFKSIKLQNLFFYYNQKDSFLLSDITFDIKKRDFIGIIGESGCGKSTLVDIILGLLKPISGKILVDDADINLNIREWQNILGYVPQKIFLTDDTIKNNIALGISEDKIDQNIIDECVNFAEIQELIDSLPKGLETLVGERGVKLSGGQIQRIGIARALYNNPDILILDEATSALDTETEKKIMKSVNQLKNKKTIIIISHRMSSMSGCDKIIAIDKGKIILKKYSNY